MKRDIAKTTLTLPTSNEVDIFVPTMTSSGKIKKSKKSTASKLVHAGRQFYLEIVARTWCLVKTSAEQFQLIEYSISDLSESLSGAKSQISTTEECMKQLQQKHFEQVYK